MENNSTINDKIPQLRFPGFTGEWREKKLNEVFSRVTRKNAENNQNVLTISAQYGLISQLEFFKKSVASSDVTGYYLLHKGEFAYNKSSSQGRPVGAIKPLRLYDKGVVSTLYICFKCNNPEEIDFWEQYFDAGILDSEILSIAQEGARNHGLLNISTGDFFGLNVFLPTPPEMKKITECLSSFDDVITAAENELDSLKVHKKGLMQQLFPQPGATTPALRFPGYSGEWEEKTLGEVATSFSGGTPKSGEPRFYGGSIPFIRSGEIHGNKTEIFITEDGLKNSSAKLVKKGDLLFALYGATSGEVDLSKIEGAINQAILCIRSEVIDTCFLYNYLSHRKDHITSHFLQGGQGNLSSDIIMSLAISFPPFAEQQKVASCLTEMDNIISAQEQKVESLKAHKKGLMQQLFPQLQK